jgi:ribonuclease HI
MTVKWPNAHDEAPAVVIHTDGACIGNPGPGGWAAVVQDETMQRRLDGSFRRTTNNRMELRAASEALEWLDRPRRVALYTDSEYLRNGITSWIQGWQRRNWRTSTGRPVKNKDLWLRLLVAVERHAPAGGVSWHWVRGHAGNRLNELADRLAQQAARAATRDDLIDIDDSVTPDSGDGARRAARARDRTSATTGCARRT